MKTTFLIYKDVNAEKKELKVATHDEWDAIMRANKGLPMNERRLFIKDCFEGDQGLDCMFIETSLAEYRKWHTQYVLSDNLRKDNSRYLTCSFDAPVNNTELEDMAECMSDGLDNEQIVIDELIIESVRISLREWKPWAEEMLDYYLHGQKRTCTNEMMKKYGLKRGIIARRKLNFEKKIIEILSKE